MKQSSYGSSRFQRFINGRGFYAVLAACLLSVGGIALALVGQGLFTDAPSDVSEPPASQAEPVEQVVTNQPDDRTTTTTTTTAATTTTTTTKAADLYVLPFGNLLQKAYSAGQPAYCETMGDWRLHNGADFAGDLEQPVKALARGTVLSIEEDAMWGNVITIDHGMDVFSRYCGVKASVKQGEAVDVGKVIGKLVEIPCESAVAPHLHLEITVDGQIVDPVETLGREVRYPDAATE